MNQDTTINIQFTCLSKLHNIPHTQIIWSNSACSLSGITPCISLTFLSLPMARSTCIRALAILRVFVTARLLNMLPHGQWGDI